MRTFLKKNRGNLLFLAAIALLIIPQTRTPIQVFTQRLIAFSPSEIEAEERELLIDYDWRLQTLGAETKNLSRSEGKVVLINLWATWCPPCIAEMPSLQKLYDSYGDRVDFYFVSPEEPSVVQNFLQKKGYTFPAYIEVQTPPEVLRTQTIPTTYLISEKGEIVIEKTGVANWNSEKVHDLLNGLIETE